jgi:hypothetical protein
MIGRRHPAYHEYEERPAEVLLIMLETVTKRRDILSSAEAFLFAFGLQSSLR